MSHDVYIHVCAYTGFDAWYYWLSDETQASKIMKRTKAPGVILPSGTCWKMVDGKLTQVQRHPALGSI